MKLMKRAGGTFVHYCPSCKDLHQIPTQGDVKWSYNGDPVRPTFNPSIRVSAVDDDGKEFECHYFLHNGVLNRLSDSTYGNYGSQELPDIPDNIVKDFLWDWVEA